MKKWSRNRRLDAASGGSGCKTTATRQRQYVRNVAFIDQAVVSGGNFVAGILMARAFGAYHFGWFVLAWLLVEFMSSLQFAMVIQPMLNIGVKEDEAERDRYYCAVVAQHVAVSIVSAVLVWGSVTIVASLFPNPDLKRLALPLCMATITYQTCNFFRRYLFSTERPLAALCNDLLRFCLQLSALLAVLLLSAQPDSEVGIWIVAGACAVSTLHGAALFRGYDWDDATFHRVLVRHWEFSKWLIPSAIMYWMTSQAFVLMSGFVLGAAETGRLRAVAVIAGALNIMLQTLDSFAPSQAAQAMHSGGRDELLRYIARLGCLVAVLVGSAAALLSIDPEFLVRVIYGAGYEGVGYMVRWLCAVAVIYGFSLVLCIWAAAIERTRIIFFSYAITTCFTVVVAYPLTQYGGLEGVLIGFLLVETIKVVALCVPLMRWRRRALVMAVPPA